jgi:putative transposase
MAWELKKVEEQRKQLVELYFNGDHSMSDICAKFGVSRKTGYKWIHRYNEGGVDGLQDLSKAPNNPNRVYSQRVIDKAIDLKIQHCKWGPKKILAKLKRENPTMDCPSERRIYDIFKNLGFVTKRRLRKRVPATEPLKDVIAANDTWMGDFKGWFLTKNGEKCEPFTVTDGQSRYVN